MEVVEWFGKSGDELWKYPIVLVPLFFFLRWFLFEYVFKPFGRRFGPQRNDIHKQEKMLHKLAESMSKIVYYAPISIFGGTIVWSYGLLANTRLCWTSFPSPPIDPEFSVLYGIQTSYYIYLVISHLFFDARRKDFWQMLIHHVVTLILVFLSWKFYYLRIGAIVFLTMDICDVFLEYARSSNYLGWELSSNIGFALLLLIWAYLRLYTFPVKVIGSALFEMTQVHEEEGFYEWSRPMYYICVTSLFILFFLQIYWFGLLIRVLIKFLKEGQLTDVTDKQQVKEHSTVEQKKQK